jgi:hypothetical protein
MIFGVGKSHDCSAGIELDPIGLAQEIRADFVTYFISSLGISNFFHQPLNVIFKATLSLLAFHNGVETTRKHRVKQYSFGKST